MNVFDDKELLGVYNLLKPRVLEKVNEMGLGEDGKRYTLNLLASTISSNPDEAKKDPGALLDRVILSVSLGFKNLKELHTEYGSTVY